jgi:hypothetical protein
MSVRLSAVLAGLVASVLLTGLVMAAEPASPVSNKGASPMPTESRLTAKSKTWNVLLLFLTAFARN